MEKMKLDNKQSNNPTSSPEVSVKALKEKLQQMASVKETFRFILECGPGTRLLFVIGSVAAILNGVIGPMICIILYFGLQSGASFEMTEDVYDDMKKTSIILSIMAFYSLVISVVQSVCFDIIGRRASKNLGRQWFQALLRQDFAFFDVNDIAAISNSVHPSCMKYQNGVGKKFGEGIQSTIAVLGGTAFAIGADWKFAFIVLAATPAVLVLTFFALQNNKHKSARSATAYSKAGGIAYSTISSIKTVFTCNAAQTMIQRYSDATQEAYEASTGMLLKIGIINGSRVSCVISMFVAVSLIGPYLLYAEVEKNGCDPSGGIPDNFPCSISGVRIAGTLLGFMFALDGLQQVISPVALFIEARVAVRQALSAINRKVGTPEERIYKEQEVTQVVVGGENKSNNTHSESELSSTNIQAVVPKYEIDSFSTQGLKPSKVDGRVSFENVSFSYPARPATAILENFSLEFEAGKTVALVGPSGGGKSTVMSMIERLYDPTSGTIELDGIDLKKINVPYLRSLIGYVGQEPTLFATSVRKNIEFGCPGASMEQIVMAAKLANADHFIRNFPDGYDTQVGDKGSQLSGGQKQRIAIARILVGNPKILLLDEATSALDSESELIVQNAIDNVISNIDTTTIIIAHRLSTIRNADLIAVIAENGIVEKGTHAELMSKPDGWYRTLVEQQEVKSKEDEIHLGQEEDHEEEHAHQNDDEIENVLRRDSTEAEGAVSVKEQEDKQDEKHAGDNEEHLVEDEEDEKCGSKENEAKVSSRINHDSRNCPPPHINFKNVNFAYPTRSNKNIFDGLSLSISAGETVAVVGPSGGGKSTILALIERLYDPDTGVVEYMGNDIKDLNVRWYRDQIGYVSQEPVLLSGTISDNISCGNLSITQEMIEEAAKQANAHSFIVSFPDGYGTSVGERGTQLSGGQKQRIAIARALVNNPKVLLLDESTSALDGKSESLIQATLDKLVAKKDRTIIIIAHRLSTVKNSDKIAFVSDGQVQELGSHAELMTLNGRYKRLVEAQKRSSTLESVGLTGRIGNLERHGEDEDKNEFDENRMGDCLSLAEEDTRKYFNSKRAFKMISPEISFLSVGIVGSLMLGSVYTAWGVMLAETTSLLFHPVLFCSNDDEIPLAGYDSCQAYWSSSAAELRQNSYRLAIYWMIVVVDCLVGTILVKWGMGMANERLVKRMRDTCFHALVSQEVSFFDMNSIGTITSILQDDTMKIYDYAGEPVYSFFFGVSSITMGVIAAFIFVWPVAIVALLTVPFMGLSLLFRARSASGTNQKVLKNESEDHGSPGGIIAEALLNIRTVSALTLESKIFEAYKTSLHESRSRIIKESVLAGLTDGFANAFLYWIFACIIWFGSWIVLRYGDLYSILDVLRAIFAIYFSLFALGCAYKEVRDSEALKKAVGRVFFLQDRKSNIDALSIEGQKHE